MSRRATAMAAVLIAAGALAPVARADGTPTTPVPPPPITTTTPTTPTPAPVPVAGHLGLRLPDVFVVDHGAVSVPGRAVTVRGVVRPYVAGQVVSVEVLEHGHVIERDRLRVKPSGRVGAFVERVRARGPGVVTVRVVHNATRQMSGFSAVRRYAALDEHIGFGSRGRFVQLIQQRLVALHLFLPRSGVYDSYTGLAIDAYHRLLGWGSSERLDGRTISYLLDGFGAFNVRFPGHGDHAEGDLTHQLLALIQGSRVYWIFPISSGKPSTPTILGDFRVYRRAPGYLPDGMYYSSFFIRGYAIHGYDPAPDYPASHGCMRLPVQDAIAAYHWLSYGDWVDTYYR